jgi:hypothetical protein
MTERTVHHFGQEISLSNIVRHYRWAAHAEPQRAAFWRRLTRCVIAEYREQNTQPQRKAA